MDILKNANLCDIQLHEAANIAAVTLGSHEMDQCCPLGEFKMYKGSWKRQTLIDCFF